MSHQQMNNKQLDEAIGATLSRVKSCGTQSGMLAELQGHLRLLMHVQRARAAAGQSEAMIRHMNITEAERQ